MSPATGILADEINLILKHFRHEKIVVSTSNFVAFVYACASDLVKSSSPMDVFSIRELIGRNLFHADLFGDEFWAEKENQIGPRLKNNRLARDLAKSDTQELDVDKIIEYAARVVFTDEDGQSMRMPTRFIGVICVSVICQHRRSLIDRRFHFL